MNSLLGMFGSGGGGATPSLAVSPSANSGSSSFLTTGGIRTGGFSPMNFGSVGILMLCATAILALLILVKR